MRKNTGASSWRQRTRAVILYSARRGAIESPARSRHNSHERLMRAVEVRARGFRAGYDHQPSLPTRGAARLLCLEAQVERPRLVVDLGSGTGLSTRAWAERAHEVVGVEPNAEMRSRPRRTRPANVNYVGGYADATGLPDDAGRHRHLLAVVPLDGARADPSPRRRASCAPAASSPRTTTTAAAVVHWEVDAAFEYFRRIGSARRASRGAGRRRTGTSPRMRESGLFRYLRERSA